MNVRLIYLDAPTTEHIWSADAPVQIDTDAGTIIVCCRGQRSAMLTETAFELSLDEDSGE